MKLLLLAFFLAACTANATTPTAYAPLPPAMFRPVPSALGWQAPSPAPTTGTRVTVPAPELKPSPTPVSRLIPPTMAAKGWATYQEMAPVTLTLLVAIWMAGR